MTPGDPAGAQAQQPRTRGDAMIAELKWVHDMIRGDLRIVRQLAADAAPGRPAGMIVTVLPDDCAVKRSRSRREPPGRAMGLDSL